MAVMMSRALFANLLSAMGRKARQVASDWRVHTRQQEERDKGAAPLSVGSAEERQGGQAASPQNQGEAAELNSCGKAV